MPRIRSYNYEKQAPCASITEKLKNRLAMRNESVRWFFHAYIDELNIVAHRYRHGIDYREFLDIIHNDEPTGKILKQIEVYMIESEKK